VGYEGQLDEEDTKMLTMVEKKEKTLSNEVQGFKDRCEVLYKSKFPLQFDGNGDLYSEEPPTKSLTNIKEDQRGFREEDHPLKGKDIVNLYEGYF